MTHIAKSFREGKETSQKVKIPKRSTVRKGPKSSNVVPIRPLELLRKVYKDIMTIKGIFITQKEKRGPKAITLEKRNI